jgi:hypothetical protein
MAKRIVFEYLNRSSWQIRLTLGLIVALRWPEDPRLEELIVGGLLDRSKKDLIRALACMVAGRTPSDDLKASVSTLERNSLGGGFLFGPYAPAALGQM